MKKLIRRSLALLFVSGVLFSSVAPAHALEEQKLEMHVTVNDGGYAYLMFRTEQDRFFRDTSYVSGSEEVADFLQSIEMNKNLGKQFRCTAKISGQAIQAPNTQKRRSGVLTIFSLRDCSEISGK